jgi:hypothetical protein
MEAICYTYALAKKFEIKKSLGCGFTSLLDEV